MKEQRLKDAISYSEALKKAYPDSEYMEDATKMKEELQQQLDTVITKS